MIISIFYYNYYSSILIYKLFAYMDVKRGESKQNKFKNKKMSNMNAKKNNKIIKNSESKK